MTTDIHPLSLHDALPISMDPNPTCRPESCLEFFTLLPAPQQGEELRSEEHTSELQSRGHLVCRLLLANKHSRTGTRIARTFSRLTILMSASWRVRASLSA